MKKGLVFISVLLVISLVFNVFQHINENNYVEYEESFELYSNDNKFIDRTVEAYDSFVRSKMGDELPIGEAYSRFFAANREKVYYAGDYESFTPDSTFVYQWTSDFISGRLHNFLIEPHYFSPQEPQESTLPQWPGGWRLSICPGKNVGLSKIVAFGRSVAEVNSAWTDWVDTIEAVGDIWIPIIFEISENINFDNKHERFLAVIGFMNGCFYHRDFNLVKDVRRNDSLKIAWDNYDWDIE